MGWHAKFASKIFWIVGQPKSSVAGAVVCIFIGITTCITVALVLHAASEYNLSFSLDNELMKDLA